VNPVFSPPGELLEAKYAEGAAILAQIPRRGAREELALPLAPRPLHAAPPRRPPRIAVPDHAPGRFIGRVSPATRRAWRRLLVVLALTPVLVLIATRMANIVIDPLLGGYGFLTLAITTTLMYTAFVHYRDPSDLAPADPAAPSPHVTCLVAIKNEVEVIESCLVSMLDQTYADVEVIAVDDASTDGTTELLHALAEEYPSLQVLALPRSVGKKYALSIGSAYAAGDLFVYTDSDCVMAHDAIDRVVRAFAADPDLGALSGHARALNADRSVLTRMQDTWYEGQFAVWKAAESTWGAVSCISGPLAAFRREAVYNILPAWANDRFLGRPFRFATDRQLTGYVLAPERVGRRLRKRHADNPFVYREPSEPRQWKIGYVKSARVWTVVPHTFGRLVRQQVRWKKSFLRNLFFTGAFYWTRGVRPAFVFYAHVLFVLATPVMAARHLIWIPLHGAYGLTLLYLAGVTLKGGLWAAAYKAENPRDGRWVYRPLMSLLTVTMFSWLIIYSAFTVRRQVWHRG